ncbi:hypothetical protein [Synechococcus sp. WH 8020]|uniref:hypothetical protein n=1 Tax=Synechococcus sp. (strain WH8020) TaxID=32052 RepID=UPI000ADE08EF|nr:hypothetical protein [Synechococcus sp. WH 8020]
MSSEDITKNIVPIVFSRPSLHNDGRVRRQIQFLSQKYFSQVVFIGKLESNDDFNPYLFDHRKGYPYAKILHLSTRKRINRILARCYTRCILSPFLILYKDLGLFYYRLRRAFSKITLSLKIPHELHKFYRPAVKLFSWLVQLTKAISSILTALIVLLIISLRQFKIVTVKSLSWLVRLTKIRIIWPKSTDLIISLIISLRQFKNVTNNSLSRPFQQFKVVSLTPVGAYIDLTSTILGDLFCSPKFSGKSFHIYFNDIESLCILSSLESNLALFSLSPSNLSEKIKFIQLDLHEYFLDQTAVKRNSHQIDNYIDLIRSTHQIYPFSISTVSSSLASLYQKHFNIDGLDVHAIYNAPLHSSPQFSSINVDPLTLIASNRIEKIKIIHHGIASSFRQLDTLLHSLNNSEKLAKSFELNLMLVANSPLQKDYLSYLKDLAACSSVSINFLDPVPTDNIVNTISQFDIAFVGIPPISTSYANCLPNKFFESIHAGLALIAGPSLDMVNLIDKFNLGIGLNDYTEYEITQALLMISDSNFHSYKKNSRDAAIHLSFESVAELYLPT